MIEIDSDNYAAHGIETMFFPGGEPHVKLPQFAGDVFCVMRLRTWEATTFAALVLDALSRQLNVRALRAFIPYFPAARQDKAAEGNAPLTLGVVAGMFNRGDARIAVFDPHSTMTTRHLHAAHALMPSDLGNLPKRRHLNVRGIIAPDAGAKMRATMFLSAFYPEATLLTAEKVRDPRSGALSHYQLMGGLPGVGHYIIVDDICDGGGTFNLLANAFRRDPQSSDSTLELFVSHGIFSKGLANIDQIIQHITTTDSWCQLPNTERLTVLPLSPLYYLIARE